MTDSAARLHDLLPTKPFAASAACLHAIAALRRLDAGELQWLKLTGIPALQLDKAGVKGTPFDEAKAAAALEARR